MMSLDDKTLWKLQKVCPFLSAKWRAAVTTVWDKSGLVMRVIEGLRPYPDQWALWLKGRGYHQGQWIITDQDLVVTHAMPGQSYHQYGLALDSGFMGTDPYLSKLPPEEAEAKWRLFGQACLDQGLVWGGVWAQPKTDLGHCELTYGVSIETLERLSLDVGLPAIWSKLWLH